MPVIVELPDDFELPDDIAWSDTSSNLSSTDLPSDIELPEDMDATKLDTDLDMTDMDIDLGMGWVSVDQHDLMELFSPPRLAPVARSLGLKSEWSLDLVTGYDLSDEQCIAAMWNLLRTHRPHVCVLSPPCTVYSQLNTMWNNKKYSASELAARFDVPDKLLRVTSDVCKYQHRHGLGFILEHPQRASSWHAPDLTSLESLEGVRKVSFDQCRFGLVSKERKLPQQKPTTLLTNMNSVVNRFSGVRCLCEMQLIDGELKKHQTIQGQEGGMSRARWAQFYPQPLVAALVDCVKLHCARL